MIKLSHRIFALLTLTILFSCGGERADNNAKTKQETPKALQDSKLDVESYSRSGNDLTEELYKDMVDKSPELKKLEDDIDALSPKQNGLDEKFDKYKLK